MHVLRSVLLFMVSWGAGCDRAPDESARVQPAAQPSVASSAHCRAPPSSGRADRWQNMLHIPGGSVHMGSDDHEPEERPRQNVDVRAFWISRTEVTNAMFASFVGATHYVTLAERGLDATRYPSLSASQRAAGGIVFVQPRTVRDLVDIRQWWRFLAGADRRHPDGPASAIGGKDTDPVVQIAYEDALAYAHWRGHELPTEAEWERAARGGLADAPFAWGDELSPDGQAMANIWEGVFPMSNSGADGHVGRAPVGCYPANGYGLHDMAGNVWEWTRDGYDRAPHSESSVTSTADATYVIKGGSYLCAPN